MDKYDEVARRCLEVTAGYIEPQVRQAAAILRESFPAQPEPLFDLTKRMADALRETRDGGPSFDKAIDLCCEFDAIDAAHDKAEWARVHCAPSESAKNVLKLAKQVRGTMHDSASCVMPSLTEAAALIQSSFEAWQAGDPGKTLGGIDNSYDAVRLEINRLHGIMEAAPNKVKMGYSVSIGGILNAYREGDIAFEKAKEELSSLASRQSASEPSGEVCGECMAQEGGHCRHPGNCRIRALLASRPAPTDEKALIEHCASLAVAYMQDQPSWDGTVADCGYLRDAIVNGDHSTLSHELPKEQA